jgi:hypothetical protein
MKHLLILPLIVLMTFSACRKAPDILLSDDDEQGEGPKTTESIIVRSGTSFGMCFGYCVTELSVIATQSPAVTGGKLIFSEFSPRDTVKFPDRTQQRALTAAEIACIQKDIDFDAFMKLDTVIGCPDCADGGAEWVEITKNGVTRRVTFEHGASIPSIQPLLDRVRALRSLYKTSSYIYQKWDWVKSVGGIAGMTITPATAGYTEQRIYRPDGTMSVRRNGAPFLSTTYTITHEKTDFSEKEEDVIRYEDQSIQPQIMRLEGDSLHLTDLCYDCFGHTYTRSVTICD